MSTDALVFDRMPAGPARPGTVPPARLNWTFDAASGLDRPFHGLVSHFGQEIILELDQIVLETPKRAAVRATQVFQRFSAPVGRAEETRSVMHHLVQAIRPTVNLWDDQALIPEEAVFQGFPRPRG